MTYRAPKTMAAEEIKMTKLTLRHIFCTQSYLRRAKTTALTNQGYYRKHSRKRASLDSRAKCNRALCEPDLHVFAKLFEDCLKRSLEAQAFSGREIGGDDDVLDFLVGHFVDVDLTRQPAS